MTDITELARVCLKEKFDAWWEREYKHLESSKYTDAVPHIKYGFWMAYQAGGAELVEALEKAQNENELARGQLLIAHRTLLNQQQSIADLVTGRQNLQQAMGVYVHAYEEAKGQVAKDVEIKARLCRESNSLFDRLRAAEKRIAGLEEAEQKLCAANVTLDARAELAERQLAELESRTVKLPQRLQPGADGYDDWYVHSDDDGEYLKVDDVLAMLTAAGVKVEAE